MHQYVQFMPIFLAAMAGMIGLFSKKKPNKFGRMDYILVVIIISSACFSTYILYSKLRSEVAAQNLRYATGIIMEDKFQYVNLVFLISDDAIEELSKAEPSHIPNQYMFPYMKKDGHVATLSIDIFGLTDLQFEILQCNNIIRIVEKNGDDLVSYYTSFYAKYTTSEPKICPETQNEMLGKNNWTYDEFAGAAGHAIDFNTNEPAGKILDLLTRATSIGKLEVKNAYNNRNYRSYIDKAIEPQIKMYQKTDIQNPLGQDCTSVYIIPIQLKPSMASSGNLVYDITPKNEGRFIRCEISPI